MKPETQICLLSYDSLDTPGIGQDYTQPFLFSRSSAPRYGKISRGSLSIPLLAPESLFP
jgi:hypothetical protein